MDLILRIPEGISQALRLPDPDKERRLTTELALTLYDKQLLSFGKARELTGLDKWAFDELLGANGIVRHYTSENLDEDLDYAS